MSITSPSPSNSSYYQVPLSHTSTPNEECVSVVLNVFLRLNKSSPASGIFPHQMRFCRKLAPEEIKTIREKLYSGCVVVSSKNAKEEARKRADDSYIYMGLRPW